MRTLFIQAREDVIKAMDLLGYPVDLTNPLPEIIIGDIENAVGKYVVGDNIIVIPQEVFNDPDKLLNVMWHELTHSLQPAIAMLKDIGTHYYLRETELQAYGVQSYLSACHQYGKTYIDGKGIDKIKQIIQKGWHQLGINFFLNNSSL